MDVWGGRFTCSVSLFSSPHVFISHPIKMTSKKRALAEVESTIINSLDLIVIMADDEPLANNALEAIEKKLSVCKRRVVELQRRAADPEQCMSWLRKNINGEVKPEWLHNGCYNDSDRVIHIIFGAPQKTWHLGDCDTFVHVAGCIGPRVVNEKM